MTRDCYENSRLLTPSDFKDWSRGHKQSYLRGLLIVYKVELAEFRRIGKDLHSIEDWYRTMDGLREEIKENRFIDTYDE